MKHFISGSGEHGCLYDNGPNYHETLQDAVDSLSSLFDLGESRRTFLRRASYLSLNPRRDGASYCEIQECDCDTPTVHMGLAEAREWFAAQQERED